ncbi:Uncharacterized protein C32A11.02c [Choanephora cucurbitarum]|uniref:Uncharacterized protein C32A11.02c n=1 Tax=Choanephora cucurbitarum TaxID=101091 RepID=A0A1C7NQV0_9FUNG|nr:Uncharacterized protein C32A11.02c [Choanephora cucurbitarum]
MNTNTSSSSNQHNKPLSEVDPKAAKQRSAENKLQLLAVMQAISKEGRMPHNDQLIDLMERLKSNSVISSREHMISPDGKKLFADFRDLITTAEKALKVKNKEELFQSLVYHLHKMESPINRDHVSESVKSQDTDALRNESKKASSALYKIGKLMLVNNEFRSVLGELVDISQDLFNNVTGKVGNSLQQTGSDLQDSNKTTTDKSGKHLVDSALDAMLSKGDQMHDRELKRDSIHDQEPRLVNASKDDSRHQGLLNTGDSVHPNVISDSHHGTSEHQRLPEGAFDTSDVSPHNRTEEYQNKLRNQMKSHKDYAQSELNKKLPKEKQDELLQRLKLTLAEVQKNPEYQEAIETLMGLLKNWTSRLNKVTHDVTAKAKENDHPDQQSYRERAERELKTIIETWAQGQSVDPLLRGVQAVTEDARNDQELHHYYKSVINYANRLMREAGYAAEDRSTEDGKRLMEDGKKIVKGNYKDHLNNLSNEARKLMRLMAEDDISKELNHRVTAIHRDMWMDEEGNPAFKPQLLNDLKMTLLPAFIDEIKYVPLPRIEYSDSQFDVAIENLIISGDTLLPNVFDTKLESFSSFSLRATESSSQPSRQSLFIRMSEIQADIEDVVFFYKKKSGFPKLTDRGVASINIGGKGITLTVRVNTVNDNPAKTFKVVHCKANVDNLSIKVKDSKHDLLYKTLRPILASQIRKQIARGIETKVIEMLNQGDQKLTASIVNMNQRLQDKAYNALPEEEKAKHPRPSVSQARARPGMMSTLAAIINRNIQSRVQKRNERRQSDVSSRRSSRFFGRDKTASTSAEHPMEHSPMESTYAPVDSSTTERKHSIASPPLSPTQKHQPVESHFKNALDMSSAQEQHARNQYSQQQI